MGIAALYPSHELATKYRQYEAIASFVPNNKRLDTSLAEQSDLPVVPICRIGVALNATPNQRHILRRPAPLNEGRFAIVTNVGCRMRWTRRHGRRTLPIADGEVVWLWHSK